MQLILKMMTLQTRAMTIRKRHTFPFKPLQVITKLFTIDSRLELIGIIGNETIAIFDLIFAEDIPNLIRASNAKIFVIHHNVLTVFGSLFGELIELDLCDSFAHRCKLS